MTRNLPLLLAVVTAPSLIACEGTGGPGAICEGLPPGDVSCLNLDFPIDGLNGDNAADETTVSEEPQMCVTGDGRIYVAWIDDRRNFKDVWFTKSDDGVTFTPPVQVKQGAGEASGLDMDCVGDRVYLVWSDTRDSDTEYENIYLNYSANGGDAFQNEDTRIDNDPEGRSISLGAKVAIFQGAVHVAWFDQEEGAPDIYVSSQPPGSRQFRDPVRVSGGEEAGEYWSGNPIIDTSPDGRLHVVWEDTRHGTQDIFYSVSNADVTEFVNQVRLTKGEEFGTSYGFSPSLSVAGQNVYVVWHDTRAGDAQDIFMQYSADGGGTFFDAAQRVETDPAGSAESLNAVVVAEGDIGHIAWQDNRNGGYDIFYRQAVAGEFPTDEDGDIVEEARLDAGDSPGFGNSINPVMARDEEGTTVVAWEDRRAGGESGLNDLHYNYQVERDEDGTEWDNGDDFRLDSIAAGTKFTTDLSVAVHGNQVYAVWSDNRDGDGDMDIYFSASPLGEGVDNLDELLADQAADAAADAE